MIDFKHNTIEFIMERRDVLACIKGLELLVEKSIENPGLGAKYVQTHMCRELRNHKDLCRSIGLFDRVKCLEVTLETAVKEEISKSQADSMASDTNYIPRGPTGPAGQYFSEGEVCNAEARN